MSSGAGPGKPVLNHRGVIGKIVGGWQVNGILSYQAGTPIQVVANNTLPLFNSGNTPDSIPGQSPITVSKSGFDPNKQVLLNINAFAVPGANKFGTSGQVLPNARNFPTYNEDFGLLKRTTITEQMNLEFRFEMFNAFNRTVFGGPANNVSDPGNFGRVTSQANGPRNGQFALKLNF